MKRYFLVGLVLLLALTLGGSVVLGGAKRIVKYGGQITDTLEAADSETRLSGKIGILNTSGNLSFDELVIGFNIPNMTDVGANDGEGITDSIIMRLLTGTGANVDTIATWTDTLPATFTMRATSSSIFRDSLIIDISVVAGTITDSIITGYEKVLQDTTSVGFYNDLFWFSAYVVDTAASQSGKKLEYVITWWAKFIEYK